MASLISSFIQSLYPLRKKLNTLLGSGSEYSPAGKTDSSVSIYYFQIRGLDGGLIDLRNYKGKKMLLVNTASECGFTPQYAGLQQLHQQYGNKVAVIGFPSNNFGAQEPGTAPEILSFCTKNYGVTFPLAEKSDVTGPAQNEVFRWLTKKEYNGWNDKAPNWNFCKYLVDEQGKLINFYSSKVDPLDEKIITAIKTA